MKNDLQSQIQFLDDLQSLLEKYDMSIEVELGDKRTDSPNINCWARYLFDQNGFTINSGFRLDLGKYLDKFILQDKIRELKLKGIK